MGYTHYWGFKSNPKDIKNGAKKFKNSVELLKKCIQGTNVKLAGGNGTGKPIFIDTKVCFNGDGDDSCETCHLALDNADYDYEFCKTEEKPYDVVVCLTLLCFKKFFKDDFNYSSDGNMNDNGWSLANKIFNKFEI